jgi:predicted transcriptional regulator
MKLDKVYLLPKKEYSIFFNEKKKDINFLLQVLISNFNILVYRNFDILIDLINDLPDSGFKKTLKDKIESAINKIKKFNKYDNTFLIDFIHTIFLDNKEVLYELTYIYTQYRTNNNLEKYNVFHNNNLELKYNDNNEENNNTTLLISLIRFFIKYNDKNYLNKVYTFLNQLLDKVVVSNKKDIKNNNIYALLSSKDMQVKTKSIIKLFKNNYCNIQNQFIKYGCIDDIYSLAQIIKQVLLSNYTDKMHFQMLTLLVEELTNIPNAKFDSRYQHINLHLLKKYNEKINTSIIHNDYMLNMKEIKNILICFFQEALIYQKYKNTLEDLFNTIDNIIYQINRYIVKNLDIIDESIVNLNHIVILAERYFEAKLHQ